MLLVLYVLVLKLYVKKCTKNVNDLPEIHFTIDIYSLTHSFTSQSIRSYTSERAPLADAVMHADACESPPPPCLLLAAAGTCRECCCFEEEEEEEEEVTSTVE